MVHRYNSMYNKWMGYVDDMVIFLVWKIFVLWVMFAFVTVFLFIAFHRYPEHVLQLDGLYTGSIDIAGYICEKIQ